MKSSSDRLLYIVSAVLVLLMSVNGWLSAGTKEFHDVLHTVEHSCGVHHTRMPFVNLMVKMAMPFAGEDAREIKDLHFAVIELRNKQAHCPADLQELIAQKLGPSWAPFVRVHSNRDHEDAVLFMELVDKDPRLIIASLDDEDGAVVQVRFTDDAIRNWVAEDEDGTLHSKKHKDKWVDENGEEHKAKAAD
jgi:hypothetical protein